MLQNDCKRKKIEPLRFRLPGHPWPIWYAFLLAKFRSPSGSLVPGDAAAIVEQPRPGTDLTFSGNIGYRKMDFNKML